MINYKKIYIRNISDYDKLLSEGVAISGTHIDSKIVVDLKKNFGTRCSAILVEYPYYEKDYLSTYYTFYSKQHIEHSKECFRLHFFGEEKENASREYLGYISLRDGIKESKIGKSYLSPKLVLPTNEKAYLILDKFNANIYGRRVSVTAFPWMRQETDISICAHVAIWSILRYYGNKFKDHRDTVMGEIVETVQNERGRKVPSKGLTPDQIVNTLDFYNFSPVLLGDEFHKLHYFLNEIIAYIESGIPVIATMNRKKHAITLFGHGTVDYEKLGNDATKFCEEGTEIILHSSLIETVYAIDDNHFPYKQVDSYIPISDKDIDYALCEINYLIVPYCQKVLLGFNEIYEKFMDIVRNKVMEWNGLQICRIYLTASNPFKEKAADNELMDLNLKRIIRTIDMPRFIWCIDLSTIDEAKNGLVSGRIIVDSTVGTQNENPWLLMHNKTTIEYINDEGALNHSILNYEMPAYNLYVNNLRDKDTLDLYETQVWEEINWENTNVEE